MWVQLLVVLAIAAAAAGGTFKLTVDHFHGVIAQRQVELDKKLAEANQKAADAATSWQAWAEAQPAKIVYRDRKARQVFAAAPDWSAQPLPASVQQLLLAPAPGADPGQPDGAVPAAGAASAADQRGSGAGVPRVPRFIRELFSSPPSTGASGAAGN